MTLWIDEPIWPAHGRYFAHLVSDTSYEELHAFAAQVGINPRAFDGDHYDIPDERWQQVVDAGVRQTTGADLTRRLNASGLRLRKRKGDRAIRRYLNLSFPNGTSHVDLVGSLVPIPEDQVFAAMVFVRDQAGSFVIVYSRRRDEWGSPGGWREPGESPAQNAVRECREETGLVLDAAHLRFVGYERFTPVSDNLIVPGRGYLQVFAATVPETRPSITKGDDGIEDTMWVDPAQYAHYCQHLFWWPLAVHVYPELG